MRVENGASGTKHAPSALLISLVDTFLTNNGLQSTHSSFAKELKRKRQIEGWENNSGTEVQSKITLEKLLENWDHKQKDDDHSDHSSNSPETSEDETSSSGESESDSGSVIEESQSSDPSTGERSSADSSASESGIKSKKIKRKIKSSEKVKQASFHSTSSSSTSESDADDEDEGEDNFKVEAVTGLNSSTRVAKTITKSLKRKAQSISTDALNTESHRRPRDQTSKSNKPGYKQVRSPSPSSSSGTSESSSSASSSGDDVVAKSRIAVSNSSTSASSEDSSESETSSDDDDEDEDDDEDDRTSAKPSNSIELPEVLAVSKGDSDSSSTVVGDTRSSSNPQSRSLSSATSSDSITEKTRNPSTTVITKIKQHTGAQPTPLAQLSSISQINSHISNAYQSYDYAERAYHDLSVTRGKNFTKEKNKKKRGSYRGGAIDTSGGKGFKFDD